MKANQNTRIYVVDFKRGAMYLLSGDLDLLAPITVKKYKEFPIEIAGNPLLDFEMRVHRAANKYGMIAVEDPTRILVYKIEDINDFNGVLDNMYELVEIGSIYQAAYFNKDYLYYILKYLKFVHSLYIPNSKMYGHHVGIELADEIYDEMNDDDIGMYDHLLFHKDNLYLIEFPYHQVQEEYVNLNVKQITNNGECKLVEVLNAFKLKDLFNCDQYDEDDE